jgi:hypothetical protein
MPNIAIIEYLEASLTCIIASDPGVNRLIEKKKKRKAAIMMVYTMYKIRIISLYFFSFPSSPLLLTV